MAYPFVYTGIRVRDLDRAVRFYTEALGMRLVRRTAVKETAGEYAVLRSPDAAQVLELNWYAPGSSAPHAEPPYATPGDALDHLAFVVGDVDQAYSDLLAKGAKPLVPPFDEGEERLAFVTDPDGTPIELLEAFSGA